MNCIFFTVLACFAMTAEPHPFLGENVAAGVGKGIENVVGTGVAVGLGTVASIGAGAIGLGAGVVDGIANGVGNALGLGGSAQRASKNIQQGSREEARQDHAEEAGVHSEESHKRSDKKYHDHSHHRSSVTTYTKVENSDDHDVSGSQAVDESAHEAGASKDQSSGTNNYDDDYESETQEEDPDN